MTRRNPPAKWVLPTVVDPPKRRCYQIYVPDEQYHVAAFMGALLNLASAYKWADDPAHTARDVANVWKEVIFSMQSCTPKDASAIGVDTGVELMIRQNPTNPCILESSIDGINWCAFADLSLCLGVPPQIGDGAEQPRPGGGQACYNGELQANGLWLLPAVVNTGDTLDITSALGAGTDGGAGIWYCPNGNTFVAGQCLALTGGLAAGDPASTVNHMRLVWNINGSYYDAMGGPLTVPSSVVNAQVTLQVNDSAIANNSGSYQFTVCVTNNQASTWISVLDFTSNSYSSVIATTFGTWVSGTGYIGGPAPSGDLFVIILQLATSAFEITSWITTYDGSGSSGVNGGTVTNRNGVAYATGGPIGTGTGLTLTGTGDLTGTTALAQSFNTGTTNANFAIKSWTIAGKGAKPPQLP